MRPTLHIHLLGDFLLTSDGIPITPLNISRLQSLLAYLLLHRDAPLNRSHLAFLLWPESTEAQAHTNLRKLLYQLRQALPGIDQFLYSDKQTLQWQPTQPNAPWALDIQDIEQALEQAKQAEQTQDTSTQRKALERVLQLYRGDLLPGCYEEWILPERDRWHQIFLTVAERLIALLEQKHDYDAAITAAQQLLRHDPLHETTYRQLMHLYALRGDRAAALRIYHACVTALERELGTEPSEVTQKVYETLMQSDLPSRTLTGSLTSRGTAPPLLGRKAEWRQLLEGWRKAANGQQRIVILSGEAGIGKTRLAEEMEAWVSRQGMATASTHCYAGLGPLAYAPVTNWLRGGALQASFATLDPIWLTEIARLVPEVLTSRPHLPRPSAMTEGWQRQHFFEALTRTVLSAHQPLLLLLDDMQWCDHETLEWLHYLLRFDPQARILLLGTVRAEETPPGHPLREFLSALQRDDLVTEIALGPLTMEEATSLAEHILGRSLDSTLSTTLHSETEGNPLFVVEMVRAGTLEQPDNVYPVARSLLPLLTQHSSTLPPSVQIVLATRLAQLSPLARDVANVAAVIGRAFPFPILARASGQSEEAVVQGLDELWQRRIIREQGEGITETYDFSHDKLREIACASLSSARQRLLHRRIAEAFEDIFVDALDTVSGQIAAHYERAGLPEKAIPYYRRAGETALRFYVNADAIAAFQRATMLLTTGTVDHPHLWKDAAGIYTSLGNICAKTGRLEEARQLYQSGIASIPAGEYIWQARLQRMMAITWNLASDNLLDTFHVSARQNFQEAAQILEQAPDKTCQEWQQEWIQLQLDQLFPLRGSVEAMSAIIEKTQPLIDEYGTAEQQGRFFQAVIARNSKLNRYIESEESIAYRRRMLAMVMQTDNKDLIGFAHFVLGNGLLFANYLVEAEEQMRMAITLAEQIGSTPLLVRALAFLALILRRQGRVEDVRAVITRALNMPEARNIPAIKGNRAWLAWRDGTLVEAEAYGRASLENGRANAFHWIGLWPLIGINLKQGKLIETMDHVCMLLDPDQQPPSEQIERRLKAALQAWQTGKQEEARTLLLQVVPVAEEMGYL